MWLLQHFMKDPSKAALTHRMCTTENDDPQKEGNMTTYCQVVNHRLVTYATDEIIAEAEAKITNFEQPDYIFAVGYPEVLWEKALSCGRV